MSEDERKLNELQQNLIKAWVEGDREFIEATLTDDWTVTDLTGRVLTKAEVIKEGFESGTRKLDSGAIDDVRVRLFGDVAVVTGRTTASGSYEGNSVTVKLRFTDVCIRRGDNWQIAASQATMIAE
jgi:ketosteroid isomerase-like protein